MKQKLFLTASALVLALLMTSCASDEKYSYYNAGHWPAYDTNTQKWGYIDRAGKFTIEPSYSSADYFCDGLALVKKDGADCYVDEQGKEFAVPVADAYYEDFRNGFAVVEQDDSCGLINRRFEIALPLHYKTVGHVTANRLLYYRENTKDAKYGFCRPDGTVVIEPQFDRAKNFVGGRAVVVKDGKFAIINAKGEYSARDLSYVDVVSLSATHFLFQKNLIGGYGIMDEAGNEIIEARWSAYKPFANGVLPVCDNSGKWGAVNEYGETVLPFKYDAMDEFFDGYTVVKEGDNYKLIDAEETVVFNGGSSDIPLGEFNGLILVMRPNSLINAEYRWQDMDGKFVYSWTGLLNANFRVPFLRK